MKRMICLVLALVLAVSVCGCSSNGSTTSGSVKSQEPGKNGASDQKDSDAPAEKGPGPEESIADKLDVTGYSYKSDFSNYFFMVVKNNSELNAEISVEVNFYDDSGKIVGAKSGSQEALESGHETLLYFMPDEDYATVEYEITAKEETFYECVQSDLTYEATEAKDKIIVSVTNNGEKPAEFAQVSVLFFNGEDVVGFDQNYVTDDDSELKPGKTINKELDCYKPFDSYLVFLSGRRH